MAETIGLPQKAGKENLLNPLTGLLSKAVDTAAEVYLVREGAKADSKRAIGTVAPSGQVDPARVESNKVTANQPQTPAEYKTENKNALPMVIGISVGAAVIIGVLFLAAKGGKKG